MNAKRHIRPTAPTMSTILDNLIINRAARRGRQARIERALRGDGRELAAMMVADHETWAAASRPESE